mgnify:CR=1 FL=1
MRILPSYIKALITAEILLWHIFAHVGGMLRICFLLLALDAISYSYVSRTDAPGLRDITLCPILQL